MANTELDTAYTLRLTGGEFRLITLSLSGRLKEKEDKIGAAELSARLCHQREHMLSEATSIASKATEGANKLAEQLRRELK